MHRPVLLDEVITALNVQPNGKYVDATFGRGGHSQAILNCLDSTGRLLMVDRDPEAIRVAEANHRDDPRVQIWRGAFSGLAKKVEQIEWRGQIDGILLDLGVSSPQLDQASRGFSFMQQGPLDMRMDPEQGVSAKEWLNSVSEKELVRVFRDYGEERHASRIARKIVAQRQEAPLSTTLELAELVASVVRNPRLKRHPATRVFQAIRIAVNDELGELRTFLDQAIDLLAPSGRLAIISFHSLEDRMVKRFVRSHSEISIDLPPGIPMLPEAFVPTLKRVGRAVRAEESELAENPRARSAILRVAEKVA